MSVHVQRQFDYKHLSMVEDRHVLSSSLSLPAFEDDQRVNRIVIAQTWNLSSLVCARLNLKTFVSSPSPSARFEKIFFFDDRSIEHREMNS